MTPGPISQTRRAKHSTTPPADAPARRGARWLLIAAVLLVFGCVLLVNGLVHGEYAADHRIAPPVGTSRVPANVQAGGPVINPARTYKVPAKTVILTFDDGPS